MTCFRISNDSEDDDHPAIRGSLNNIAAPSGLKLHATDTTYIQSTSAEWLNKPAFVVAIVLEGRIDAWLDGSEMDFGTNTSPIGRYWNITKPAKISRKTRKGERLRKVVIGVPQSWIRCLLKDCDSMGLPNPMALVTHQSRGSWAPSRHALALAEQIINPTSEIPMLSLLSAEAKAIEIVREALGNILTDVRTNTDLPNTVEVTRAKNVRDRIMTDLGSDLNLAGIARDLGVSVGSMQAAFKATYSMTIGAFIREQRLNIARDAIEQEGMRVSEAAYLAGYDSPASFSTAFRRAFGFPPSNCKR